MDSGLLRRIAHFLLSEHKASYKTLACRDSGFFGPRLAQGTVCCCVPHVFGLFDSIGSSLGRAADLISSVVGSNPTL